MHARQDRREFMQLWMGIGAGAVFASRLAGSPVRSLPEHGGSPGPWPRPSTDDFFFLQLSDTHWGFTNPAVNPEADETLRRTVALINEAEVQPDFLVFTGDLTHTTDDPGERRRRMREFKEIVGGLKTETVRFLPGEHDASLDRGEAYQEVFGPLHDSFDHKGLHFVALDNVSDPTGSVGDRQLEWLREDLRATDVDAPIVVLTHRPLFDLYPAWDWSTRDGGKVIDLLQTRRNVTVFYGHVHQENHHVTGTIEHHSARSLMFPLPAPGSVPKKAPIPWDPARPYDGLGYRRVDRETPRIPLRVTELPVSEA